MWERNGERGRKREDAREWRDEGKGDVVRGGRQERIFLALD